MRTLGSGAPDSLERLGVALHPAGKRVLLLVNRGSGIGRGTALAGRLQQVLTSALGGSTAVQLELVDEHAEARARTASMLQKNASPACIFVGGGGGTLRAVVEAVLGSDPQSRQNVRVAPLRMGSGNVVAKLLGVPPDPVQGIELLAQSFRTGRVVRGAVIGAEWGGAEESVGRGCAVTMAGLGQFGRAPGDLVRWHRRFPRLRRVLSRLVGIERLNDAEYATALGIRSVACCLSPSRCEWVDLDGQTHLRLLAGVALNFPIAVLPFDSGVRFDEPVASLHVIAYPGRLASLAMAFSPRWLARKSLTFHIDPSREMTLRFDSSAPVEFFLDEDPEMAQGWLRLRIEGLLDFVPVHTREGKEGKQG